MFLRTDVISAFYETKTLTYDEVNSSIFKFLDTYRERNATDR